MDELRLAEMSHMFSRLCLIGSLMLITSNFVGSHLSTNSAFIKRLKDHLFVLLDGVPIRYGCLIFDEIYTSTRFNLSTVQDFTAKFLMFIYI